MSRNWNQNQQRNSRVAQGLCGFCSERREHFDFLCNACAAKHRERQIKVVCPWCDGVVMLSGSVPCHACDGIGRVTGAVAKKIQNEMGIVAQG